jgi:hypothetical protein
LAGSYHPRTRRQQSARDILGMLAVALYYLQTLLMLELHWKPAALEQPPARPMRDLAKQVLEWYAPL